MTPVNGVVVASWRRLSGEMDDVRTAPTGVEVLSTELI